MVVHINKILLLLTLMLMSAISLAEEPYKYKKQVLSKLQEKAELAMVELEDAAEKCYQDQKKSNLNASHFKDLNISHKEMMITLFYFSAKARLECITEIKFKNLAYSLLKYQRALKYYNQRHELKFFNKDSEFLPYAFFDRGIYEEFEIIYNELPLKHRTALEQIPELSKPFDSGKLLRQVELEIYGITPKDVYY